MNRALYYDMSESPACKGGEETVQWTVSRMRSTVPKVLYWMLAFLLVARVTFSAPFSDLPREHWASQAVQILEDKGILKGINGKFHGGRAMTRYEMAVLVARLAEYLNAHPEGATKRDLEMLRSLVKEYEGELDSLGVRLSRVEKGVADLSARVDEASRIRFFAHHDSIGSYMWVANKGSNFVQAFDFSNGRPLAANASSRLFGTTYLLTSLFDLDLSVPLSEDWRAGGRFSAYAGIGSGRAGDPRSYWGVTPPYLNNWWTGFPGGLDQGELERIWARYDPADMELVHGTYNLRQVDGFVFKEEPNPTYYGPDYLPLWGTMTRGNLSEINLPWVSYEFAQARIPSQAPYLTKALADNVRVDLGKTVLSLDFLRVDNDVTSIPFTAPVITPLSNPFQVQSTFGGAVVTFVGPQAQYSWGGKVTHRFSSTLRATAEYAYSRYSPDTERAILLTGAQSGRLWRVQAEGSFLERGQFQVEYLSVDPNYDPFVLGFPGGAIIRNFAIWNNLPNFYFLHDSLNYPHNRQGVKGLVQWNFGRVGVLSLYGSSLTQKHSTAILGNNFPVYIEPIFITSPNAGFTVPFPFLSIRKGTVRQVGGFFSSQVTSSLKGGLSVGLVRILRPHDPTSFTNTGAPGFRNDWDETYTVGSINLEYALTPLLAAQAGLGDIRLLGTQNGFSGYSINQLWWYVALSHNLTRQAAALLEYRMYNTKEATPPYGAVYPLSSQGPFFGNSLGGLVLGRLIYNF